MTTEEIIKAMKAAAKEAAKEVFEAESKTGKVPPRKPGEGTVETKETNHSKDNDLMEIIKTRVTYEDVMHWIKENIKPAYNGVFIHRSKARFFDKGDYSLKIFFAIDKEPQTGDNDPAIVFTYEKLDDALNDMLSEKDTILVRLNNKSN